MGSFDRSERQVSRRTLASRMRLGTTQLDAVIRELLDLGALETRRDVAPGGQKANVYDLCAVRTGYRSAGRGGTGQPGGGVPVSRDPSISELGTQSDAHPGFQAFYEIYPRHENRATAEQAFSKAVLGSRRRPAVDVELILAGARRYRDDPNREAAYTTHATTWLNQRRWEDDPLPPRKRARGDIAVHLEGDDAGS